MTLPQRDLNADLPTAPTLRSTQEQAVRTELARLADWFPDVADWREVQSVRLPAEAAVVSPEQGTEAFRREVVQGLIDTAAAIAARKPAGAKHARIAAIIDWPLLVGSEICVFFDRNCERSLAPETERRHGRTFWPGGWVSSAEPERNLFETLTIALPAGFAAAGIALTEYSKDTDHTYRYERWVAMETLERIAQ